MNPSDFITAPLFDPNDAGGTSPAAPAPTNPATAAPVTPAPDAPPADAAPVSVLPGEAEVRARANLLQLHGLLETQATQMRAMQDKLAALETARATPVKSGSPDIDPALANDPAWRELNEIKTVQRELKEVTLALAEAHKAERERAEASVKEQSRTAEVHAEGQRLNAWVELVCTKDVNVKDSPLTQQLVKDQAAQWLRGFDPFGNVQAQEAQLQAACTEVVTRYKGLTGGAQIPPRDAALARDDALKNSPAVSGAAPPSAGPEQNPHKPGSTNWFRHKMIEESKRQTAARG